MKGGKRLRHIGIARLPVVLALLSPVVPFSYSFAQAADNAGATESRRSIMLPLPLIFNGSAFGEVAVQIESSGGIAIDAQSLRSELARLLNDNGRQKLDQAIASKTYLIPAELTAIGIGLHYDPARLELVIDRIDNDLRAIEFLGGGEQSTGDQPPTVRPADFSAYLNTTVNIEHVSGSQGIERPDLYLFGAARYHNVVMEIDGGFTDSFANGNYRFYRRAARAVYDDQKNFRRFSVGDLRLAGMSLLQTQLIGGVGVEKSRRIFDPFRPTTSIVGHRIFLESASTVNVLINGAPYRTLDLQPGVYDLSDLPLQYGSNDVKFVIRDAAGREQVESFSNFFDPIDLSPGDDEYSVALGVPARQLAFTPSYGNDPIFIGHYRKAFQNQLILGGAVQIMKDRQVIAGETRIVPQFIPGAFDFQAATSFGSGTGFAGQFAYRWSSIGSGDGRSASFSLDYRSRNFRLVADPFQSGGRQLNATASYSQFIGPRTSVSGGLTYSDSRALGKRKGMFADVNHMFNPRIRGSVGVQYDQGGRFANNFGIRARISVMFGNRHRADASYESRQNTARISMVRDVEDHVGSLGYGVILQDTPSQKSADVSASYINNRFDARLTVAGSGGDFGGVIQRPAARLQISSSFAFADGVFGIGRPISDSFLLARPHRALKDTEVVVGREMAKGRYEGKSGLLGAAVARNLASYNAQNVLYDVDDVDAGYDIGSGIARVNPSFRSGSVVTVGTDRFVNTLGTLLIDDNPAALASGALTAIDDDGFAPQSFFTNSAGRFSILGLAPGHSYRVTLDKGQSFVITVPADNKGLYRTGPVKLPRRE